VITVSSGIIIICVQLWPGFLDIILPINESRPRRLQIMTEYFVDQERYFYLLLLHLDIGFCIEMVVFIATLTMISVCLTHICGMFRIAR